MAKKEQEVLNNSPKEKIELQEIFLNPFPDWTGKMVRASLKANHAFKYVYDTPLVETQEDSQEIYGSNLEDLIQDGIKYRTHRVSRVVINIRAEEGKDPEDQDFCDEQTKAIPEELKKSPRVSGGKAAENKAFRDTGNSLMKKFGVSTLEELEKKIAEELGI